MATTAIYAGSFDPITRGHEDLIRRSCEFVDHLVVAVAINSSKKALFTTDERVALIRAATANNKGVEVTQFEGLLVDFARKVGAKFNIPGTPLLLTGSVLFPLTDAGLRPNVTPVIGLDYSFKR